MNCESWLLETSHFHQQTNSISKAKLLLNMQKEHPFAEIMASSRIAVAACENKDADHLCSYWLLRNPAQL